MYRRDVLMRSKLFTKAIFVPIVLILIILSGICVIARNTIVVPRLTQEKHDKAYSEKLSKDGLNIISFEDNQQGQKVAVLSLFQGGFYGMERSEPFSEYYRCPLTRIDESAYYECYGLKRIIIPNSIKTISKNAIYNCKDLEEIYIPKSVKTIDKSAFKGSHFIMYVEKGSFAEKYALENNYKYKYYKSKHNSKDKNSYPKTVNNKKFENYYYSVYYTNGIAQAAIIGSETNSITNNLKIPNKINGIPVKAISPEAFGNCQNIKSIRLSKEITSVGSGAFYLCSSLEKVYFTESTNNIGRDLFEGINHSVTICAPKDSYAHKYAQKNKIPFETTE